MYDPVSDTWVTKTPMPRRRGGLAVAVINSELFAIGGELTNPLSVVERFTPGPTVYLISKE